MKKPYTIVEGARHKVSEHLSAAEEYKSWRDLPKPLVQKLQELYDQGYTTTAISVMFGIDELWVTMVIDVPEDPEGDDNQLN